jgi:hypothetical protein
LILHYLWPISTNSIRICQTCRSSRCPRGEWNKKHVNSVAVVGYNL